MGHDKRPRVTLLACCIALSACGGGGDDDDDDSLDIAVTADGRVLSGSEPVEASDFVSRTFPLLFASAEDGLPQATTTTGTGSVRVVDENTIVVTLPGQAARTYNRISPTEFSDGTGEVLTFEDSGAARYLYKSDGDPTTDWLATYGFETPVALRPVTATYNGASASVLYFVPDGSPVGLWIGSPGTVDLVATFSGSGGTIWGTLFEGEALGLDFAGDGTADDDLFILTTLRGVIDAEGFGGTVDGFAAVSLAGGLPENLNLTLSDTSVDGKFFGEEANVASGVYAATTEITPPGGPAETGVLSGFFVVDRN
jgi:hypothetical protein